MTDYTFRAMKRAMLLVQAQTALLLSVEGLGFTKKDYALFFVMGEMVHKMDNPTRKQYSAALGATLRVYRGMVDRLQEGSDLRRQCEAEWVKLSRGFESLLEVKTK